MCYVMLRISRKDKAHARTETINTKKEFLSFCLLNFTTVPMKN